MLRKTFFLVSLFLCLTVNVVYVAAMSVQLPYVDGNRYECMQNSDDAPSHGRSAGYVSVEAPATKFDLDFALPKGTIVTAAANGTVSHGEDIKYNSVNG